MHEEMLGAEGEEGEWGCLPGPVLQAVCAHLGPEDILRARATCSYWAQEIAGMVSGVHVILPVKAYTSDAQYSRFSCATCATLHMDESHFQAMGEAGHHAQPADQPVASLRPFFEHLAATCPRVDALRLNFRPSVCKQYGNDRWQGVVNSLWFNHVVQGWCALAPRITRLHIDIRGAAKGPEVVTFSQVLSLPSLTDLKLSSSCIEPAHALVIAQLTALRSLSLQDQHGGWVKQLLTMPGAPPAPAAAAAAAAAAAPSAASPAAGGSRASGAGGLSWGQMFLASTPPPGSPPPWQALTALTQLSIHSKGLSAGIPWAHSSHSSLKLLELCSPAPASLPSLDLPPVAVLAAVAAAPAAVQPPLGPLLSATPLPQVHTLALSADGLEAHQWEALTQQTQLTELQLNWPKSAEQGGAAGRAAAFDQGMDMDLDTRHEDEENNGDEVGPSTSTHASARDHGASASGDMPRLCNPSLAVLKATLRSAQQLPLLLQPAALRRLTTLHLSFLDGADPSQQQQLQPAGAAAASPSLPTSAISAAWDIIASLPLVELNIRQTHCLPLDDTALQLLARRLPQLAVLQYSGRMEGVSERGWAELASMPRLCVLALGTLRAISKEPLRLRAKQLPRGLTCLSLLNAQVVDDEGAGLPPLLTQLSIKFCEWHACSAHLEAGEPCNVPSLMRALARCPRLLDLRLVGPSHALLGADRDVAAWRALSGPGGPRGLEVLEVSLTVDGAVPGQQRCHDFLKQVFSLRSVHRLRLTLWSADLEVPQELAAKLVAGVPRLRELELGVMKASGGGPRAMQSLVQLLIQHMPLCRFKIVENDYEQVIASIDNSLLPTHAMRTSGMIGPQAGMQPPPPPAPPLQPLQQPPAAGQADPGAQHGPSGSGSASNGSSAAAAGAAGLAAAAFGGGDAPGAGVGPPEPPGAAASAHGGPANGEPGDDGDDGDGNADGDGGWADGLEDGEEAELLLEFEQLVNEVANGVANEAVEDELEAEVDGEADYQR